MTSNRLGIIACAVAAVLALTGVACAREVRFNNPVIHGVRANVVVVDLTSPHVAVRPVVAGKPPVYLNKRTRTFTDLVKASRCMAAINGTFFDPRTANTLGSVVYEGALVHEGFVGNAVAVDRFNRAHYLQLRKTRGAGIDWTQYRFAVAAGPTLITDGRIVVSRKGEGFRDPHLFSPARRSAIGFRQNGEMLLVTVPKPVSLNQLARMMQKLGARLAINLDGGSSTAMYYKGRMLVKPKGRLTNILAVLFTGSRPPGPLPTVEELVPVEGLSPVDQDAPVAPVPPVEGEAPVAPLPTKEETTPESPASKLPPEVPAVDSAPFDPWNER